MFEINNWSWTQAFVLLAAMFGCFVTFDNHLRPDGRTRHLARRPATATPAPTTHSMGIWARFTGSGTFVGNVVATIKAIFGATNNSVVTAQNNETNGDDGDETGGDPVDEELNKLIRDYRSTHNIIPPGTLDADAESLRLISPCSGAWMFAGNRSGDNTRSLVGAGSR